MIPWGRGHITQLIVPLPGVVFEIRWHLEGHVGPIPPPIPRPEVVW